MTPAPTKPRTGVPCNGCTACCRRELLILHPELGDDPSEYDHLKIINPITGKPALALKLGEHGGCVYLTDDGCSIHERVPALCKKFDCRDLYKRRHRISRRFGNEMLDDHSEVMQAGKKHLRMQRGRR